MTLKGKRHVVGETQARLDAAAPRMGTMTDQDLSEELGIQRSTISAYRLKHGIPSFKRIIEIPEDERRMIAIDLRAGVAIRDIAAAKDRAATQIRAFAESIGWNRSWVKRRPTGLSSTVGKLQRVDVLQLYDSSTSNSAIARKAGVSSERIRQVIAQSGRPPALVKKARIRFERLKGSLEHSLQMEEQRRANREAKKLRSRDYLNMAVAMWSNSTIAEIATVYGLTTNSMSWWIFYGRSHFGLFPRKVRGRTNEGWRRFLKRAHLMWRDGREKEEIARTYGVGRRCVNRWMRITCKFIDWSFSR